LATVALANALGPLADPGGAAQAFANHDRDESAPRPATASAAGP
jgi:hypothetical protein